MDSEMTPQDVVAHIAGLRAVTKETGVLTTRAQFDFLKSLPDQTLLAAAPLLKELFDAEKVAK